MSLILEALKKSEQQRQLGEAPNLGTPITMTRRRRSLLPVLAAAIAIALGAGWYLLRDQPDARPEAAKVASTPAAQTSRAGAAAAAAKPAAQKPVAVNMPPPHAPPARKDVAADQKTAPVIAQPVLPVSPAQDRPGSVAPPPVPPSADEVAGRPHDRPPPPGPASPLDQAPKTASATTTPAANNPASASPGKPHDRPEPPGPSSPLEQAPKSASASPPAAAKPVAAPAPAVATAQPAQKPVAQRPALPSVWELPYATRKDLPAIDLTMHVYADTPADRFVVVKGERHVEGDQIADGVTLKQITADGMVLAFKGQEFTFPRDSR